MALSLVQLTDEELQAVVDSQGSRGIAPVYAPALREVLNAAGDGACAISIASYREVTEKAAKRSNVLTGLRNAVKANDDFGRITVLKGTDEESIVFQVAATQ